MKKKSRYSTIAVISYIIVLVVVITMFIFIMKYCIESSEKQQSNVSQSNPIVSVI